MTWGGLGFLNKIDSCPVIYFIRNPLFAFNSYSGGGWRSAGGLRRIAYVGAKDQNDKKWIDLFFGDFALWLDGSKNAIKAVEEGNGHIVRYHNLKKDWKQIPVKLPVVYRNFKCKDEIGKVEKYLSTNTVKYIKDITDDVWEKIEKYG